MYHSGETSQRKLTIFWLLDFEKQRDGSEIIWTESSGGVWRSNDRIPVFSPPSRSEQMRVFSSETTENYFLSGLVLNPISSTQEVQPLVKNKGSCKKNVQGIEKQSFPEEEVQNWIVLDRLQNLILRYSVNSSNGIDVCLPSRDMT